MGKSISNGFGIVRRLTPPSQQELFEHLDEAEINNSMVRRRTPSHLTVIQFLKLSKHEQKALHVGFNIGRLEHRLENGNGNGDGVPRRALTVELGAVAYLGNFIYAEVGNSEIDDEQLKLAGQIALHGISPVKINRKIVPPHIGIGHAQQGPIEEMREKVEDALSGQHVALQRWQVYPDRYA